MAARKAGCQAHVSTRFLRVDELVDRLVADGVTRMVAGETSCDLLGRPPELEFLDHVGQRSSVFESRTMRGFPLAIDRTLMGSMGEIDIVDGRFISRQLPMDRTLVAPDGSCDLTHFLALGSENGNPVTLFTA